MTSNTAAKPLAIVWFRRNLRLADNESVATAAKSNAAVIPLYIDDQDHTSARGMGGASKWWRGRSLAALDESLRAIGSRLILRRGAAAEVLDSLLAETGATTVYLTLGRDGMSDDPAIIERSRARSVAVETFDANYLHDPLHLRTASGGGFKVFTPFWNRLSGLYRPSPETPAPKTLRAPERWPDSLPLRALQVTDAWAKPIAGTWQVGEAAARARLAVFADEIATEYPMQRDRPDRDGTSRLSPHLAWGEISVHEIWRHLTRSIGAEAAPFLRQLGWRDFNMHLLHEFPDLAWQPIQPKFTAFPSKDDAALLRAWQRGLSGYPIVDAGLRQLWRTGWMHNRVRMIVGSFLVKDLLIPWQRGEEWFWDALVDADPAQNAGNWQWIAGCGADAAPFFRVFNPILQGEKFDPHGAYVRQWVPELAKLPDSVIHRPWTAGTPQLSDAGVRLGKTYPQPIVDHAQARKRALAAYQRLTTGGGKASEPSLFGE